MDLIEVWKLTGAAALVCAILTSAFNSAIGSFQKRIARTENLRYQALRVALTLERFAIACAEIISEAEQYEASNGAVGGRCSQLPILNLPERTEWHLFEISSTNTILSLENAIADGNSAISFAIYVSMEVDLGDEPELQAGVCGYSTYLAAQSLRLKYKLGERVTPVHGWDYVGKLKKLHDKKIAEYRQMHVISA